MYINEQTFRQWWEIFHTDSQLCEVRMLGKKTVSGYFTDCEVALNAIKGWYGEEFGVYACINEINPNCYLTKQRDNLLESPKSTTSDLDIKARRWILVDIDPVRKSDTNATDAQKALAKAMMRQIGIFLRDQGFASPVVADSANGYHLYYKVYLNNSDENTQTIKNLLGVLDMQFSTSECSVDTSVFNAARISKIMGTKSNKGADVAEAPRRESRFIQVPDDIQKTDISVIQKVAAMLPEKEKPSKWNGWRTDNFDIDQFIAQYGIKVKSVTSFKDGRRYVLEECPFNPDHKAPDSAIFVMSNGAIGFRCLHNSCSHYTWRDVRLHYDKDAYSKRDYEEFLHKREFYDTRDKPAPVVIAEDSAHGKKWQSLDEIEWQDPSKLVYIPTGFGQLDLKIGGLALGEISVMSGLAGCVDANTEFFNGITWKRISEYEPGDKVLQYNADGSATLVLPEAYIKKPCANMTLMKTKYGVNQCLSDEHRVVYQTSKGNLKIKTMAEIKEQHAQSKNGFLGKFYTTFSYSGEGIDLTDEQIRLMCAVVCDGTFKHKYSNKKICRINIKKQRKKDRLTRLLTEAGVEYRLEQYNPRDPEFSTFLFESPRLEKSFGEYWYGCNKHQLEVVCDEICHWDGSFCKEGMKFSTAVKETADFVQFAFSAIGKRARISQKDRTGQTYLTNGKTYTRKSVEYCLYITDRVMVSLASHKKHEFEDITPEDGYKYCFTVPSGMLVLRREGCINITGNSGKTSVINNIILYAIHYGYRVAVFSGELVASRFKSWINQAAAGRNNVKRTSGDVEYYYCPQDISAKIDGWTKGKIYLYNNTYGSKISQILSDVKDCVKANGTQLIIIDNLMALQLDAYSGDKNERQAMLINELKDFSMQSKIHILLVCHPRKEQLNQLLRMESIAGSSDLYNAAANVFLAHRVGTDFEKRASEFFGSDRAHQFVDTGYNEVIEVAKNRTHGVKDHIFGLYYEKETRRFLNSKSDYFVFGWQDEDNHISLIPPPDPLDPLGLTPTTEVPF